MDGTDKRMLEREALRNVIQQWNMNRLDIFELSEPNEDLSFHGVMRFYFQDSGQKVATKCIRVASDATVSDVIETLIEKFRPDMRMLSVASYALYELHSQEERKLANDEKPLLVQLNWHLDDREGRFLLKNVDDKTVSAVRGGTDTTNTNFKRKLSKREKKELKKKEKLSRMKSDALKDDKHPVAEKLYTELPETSFTRSISNPEAVMRRRRQQKERKLLQFRSKDGGPDTGGTLKVYGESLCPDVPYKTLLLSINDCSSNIVREMLEKYGLGKIDPQLYCLVQVNTLDNSEYILDDDECPLAIVMSHNQRGSIMFHVRRRPADCQPRRRKKKSGSIRAGGNANSMSGIPAGVLVELQSDGSQMDNGRTVCISSEVVEVGSANGVALQLYGPSIQPRHCVLGANEGVVTLTPLHTDAHTYVNGQRIHHTTILQHGCIIKFDRISTFRFVDPTQENKLNRQISQSQNFDSASMYDRSPTSPAPDNNSGLMSPISQLGHDTIQSMEPNSTGEPDSDFRRAISPINKMGSQDNFNMSYNYKNHMETPEQMANYTNNNNIMKMDNEALMLSQHLANSKSDLLQENHFASPYNSQTPMMNSEQPSQSKTASGQYKDNYETTFDLDGNVETKSICSAKSGGSGHENRTQKGQEAILPAVLEFPEHTQHIFLQNVITRLDVNIPAFKLAPVYTLYLCARYRASTHYRPELTPTERAHKLTTLLHHIASLIQDIVQEKYSDATLQAFWMANSSELLHFLKCDRHISAFTVQAQDILSNTVQAAFSNLVGCFHMELSQVLTSFLEEGPNEEETSGVIISVLNNAMALLRRCRVNAALTIQLFSQLFHYINVWCFNKVVASPHMMCNVWGALISARLAPVGAWAERQGLEIAADCHLALIHQCAHLLQAPKNTPEDIANMMSSCFKLNSVQLRCLLGGYFQETSSGVVQRLPIELIEAAVKHAQGVADELHRADGREIVLEESSSLPLSLLIPEDGFSADVVRGLPSGLAEFLAPLQRSGFCRLAPQPHSLGHWTVYMTGYNGNSIATKPPQQPVVEVIQLQKNSNGIGLSIVAAKGAGQSKLGIYIKSVVPGGAAAADQRLQAGDQLLAVDGYSLVGITQERAAEHLVRTGPVVTLHVAKQGAVLHGLATLLRQPSPQPNRGGNYCCQSSNNGQYTCVEDYLKCSSDDSLVCVEDTNCHCVSYSKYDVNYQEMRRLSNSYSYPYFTTTPSRNEFHQKEQSGDSSTQSYDSDYCYSDCPNATHLMCCTDVCKFDQYNEIPYIDDIEPLINDSKESSLSISVPPMNIFKFSVKKPEEDDNPKQIVKVQIEKVSNNVEFNVDSGECVNLSNEKLPEITKDLDNLKKQGDFGVVKTIAKHFNEINLAYQCSNYNKKSNSDSVFDKQTKKTVPIKSAQSMIDIKIHNNEYSEDERSKIMSLLEDWSKNGTKGKDDLSPILPKKSEKSNVDEVELSDVEFPLNKRCGSLEKLNMNTKPKIVEYVFHKTQSSPNISMKPAIEKTKLVIPRKKFPQSYIVKRKSTTSLSNTNTKSEQCSLNKKESHRSCPNLLGKNIHLRVSEIKNKRSRDKSTRPQYAWIQYGPKRTREIISPRRMSERDLPSKVEMEQNPMASHMGSTVKTSKSVPALHEHTKQHEVFNPGYSRTSSNNSIPAMQNMKLKSNQGQMHQQTDQSNFYQNLSVYQNTGLGDRSSNLRNSQNNLQLHTQIQTKPPNIDNQNAAERYMANQRPQSAYYGNQPIQNHLNNPNLRAAQSTKDLVFGNENYGNSQVVKGGYPSMPNVNQGYSPSTNLNMSQPYHHQLPGQPNLGNNTISRIPMSPLSSNQYNQNYGNQGYVSNPNQMPSQQGIPHNQMSNAARGQAKLAEMSEEVKRRHQRGVMNPQQHSDNLQQKRVQYGQDTHGYPPPPMNSSIPMSPVKQQPPVAPKPNIKRDMQELSQDVPEGPIPPPPSTHPLHQQGEEESGYLASSSDPPAVSFYPTHRQAGQNSQSHFPPNPWEREEREKEMEIRRSAGRAWRDQQIASLQALGEDRRTPQQEQQLRALTLERDFERRAQETQIDEDDKDLNIQPVGSNIVSSVQPISVAMSNTSSGDQQPDNPPSQQEIRVVQPPSIPSIQPKSILKSNLKLDNLNSNSPHSPSKTQKNASFSANLTPQSLKFDYNTNNKMETMGTSKYPEQNSSNYMPKYEMNNTAANQLSQSMGDLYVNSSTSYTRSDNLNSNIKFDNQDFSNNAAPPPPERGSSFAIMSQQQALRSNLSVVSQPSILSQNNNLSVNNNTNVKDKRVSFHDKDYSSTLLTTSNNDNQDNEPIVIVREDPDRFISEAEMLLQSPTTPTGPNITHTPGVIGAQEVYRDPRQKRLAEQQKAQQAGATPIPEKLSFKEKMKMFALESGESNTPKDKVKISRAQRDIDAVH